SSCSQCLFLYFPASTSMISTISLHDALPIFFICVTGVSGSGKSSLINATLQPILSQHFYNSVEDPLPYKSVDGLEFVDKVIRVEDRKSTRLNSSHVKISYAVFCLKK